MKDLPETFPGFKSEVEAPQLPEAVAKQFEANGAGAAPFEQALHFMDELGKMGYNRTQICSMALHFFPRAKTSRAPSTWAKLAQVEQVEKKAEIEQCLAKLKHGKDYGIGDFVAMLKPDSRFLAIKKDRARETAIGSYLTMLAAEGKLLKIIGRRAGYSLPESKPGES